MLTNKDGSVVPDGKGTTNEHEVSSYDQLVARYCFGGRPDPQPKSPQIPLQTFDQTSEENSKLNREDLAATPADQRPPIRRAHFRDSTYVISSHHDEWEEYIHPNGSLYWACSTDLVRVVSDIQPPLSKIHPGALSIISGLMAAIGEIPQINDYQDWEIYTDGLSCVYIHHASRSVSETAQSLEEFKEQIGSHQEKQDIKTKLRLEAAYWADMQAHPNHRDLPEGALDDATEALVWCHADRVLFRTSNAPFSKEDAQEMTDLIKTITDLKRPTLKTWYCAAVMRAISENRLASHYGQNDAREVRRRERSEDLSVTLPFSSWLHRIVWYFIALASLGTPFGYLKRINTVDRTTIGDGVNTLRWRTFLKSLCKDWQDSNLLATVLVSATVALLAIPGLNGLAQIAGIVSSLCAVSSTLCGMLLLSTHQDHLDGSGGTGVSAS
ncbi:hypothetical protein BDV93DRAFT_499869 [Ceratobasidium sp. AG-I]|nr:hypothetical protein BDV93DRAFT_499869 [Ceratobasidium sp. AG-I]